MIRSRLAVAVIALTVILGSTAAATPAQAATSTSISFSSTSLTAVFGANWTLSLKIASSDGRVLDTQDGTVDVTVSGVPGTYAAGVPIYRGGQAFLSPPDGVAPLGKGAHTLRAVFRPAAGSGFSSSQTATPATLTITGLALTASQEVIDNSGAPAVRMTQSGEYVDAYGAAPGIWSITVESGGKQVLDTTVIQPAGAIDPIDFPLGDAARPGRTLTITSSFAPDAAIAPGVTFTDAKPISYSVPSLTFAETLVQPIALPWWLFILLLLVVIGLAVTAIVLVVRNARAAATRREPDIEPVDVPIEAPIPGQESGIGNLAPSGIEPSADGAEAAVAATRVLPLPEPARNEFPLPGTADLAPMPERPDPVAPEPESPAPRSWTLSSSDDDDV